MLNLSSAGTHFMGLVLLDCQPVEAECIALFAASSAENRLKQLTGFAGAAFTTSLDRRYGLEMVCWTTPAAFAAARASPLLSDHISIVEHHTQRLHAGFSSRYETLNGAPISFGRSGRLSFSFYKLPSPRGWANVRDQVRSVAGSISAHALSHIAEDGSSFALLSYDAPGAAASRALAELFGEPHFRDEFIVVESVSPPRADEAFQPLYHLSLATDVADVR